MTPTVIVRETALRNLARIRSEDKDLFTRTRRAISALADQPYLRSAVAWGATGVYPATRLRATRRRNCRLRWSQAIAATPW